MRISMPNFIKIGQLFANILRFFDFSRWQPPSWIVDFSKFYWLSVTGGPRRITVPNLVKFVRAVAEIVIFHIFKLATAAIWDLRNRNILLAVGVERVETHQRAKFCQNRSIGCEDIKTYRFFKMAAVCHVGFVWRIFGPPTVSTCGLYQSAKFGYDQCSSFYRSTLC